MPVAKKIAKAPAPRKAVAKRSAAASKTAAKKPAPAPSRPLTQVVKDLDLGTSEKGEKARKPKLVRDSFTIPKDEYAVVEALKLRAAKLGRPAKKSEVLRAGVMALAAMGDAAFLSCVTGVPAVKTGRPAKA